MKLLICLVAALCLFAGCVDTKDKQYKIGVAQCSGGYFRDKTNDEMKRELLLHDDVEIEIRNADNDNYRQIADIKYFMDNGFDLILVSPNETEPLTHIISEVYAKGIPIVTFDRSIIGDSVTAHFEVDNYDLGKAVAKYAHSILPGKIKALEIQGPDNASPARLRHAGFTDVMTRYDNSEIVASVYGNWENVSFVWDCNPESVSLWTFRPHFIKFLGLGCCFDARQKSQQSGIWFVAKILNLHSY